MAKKITDEAKQLASNVAAIESQKVLADVETVARNISTEISTRTTDDLSQQLKAVSERLLELSDAMEGLFNEVAKVAKDQKRTSKLVVAVQDAVENALHAQEDTEESIEERKELIREEIDMRLMGLDIRGLTSQSDANNTNSSSGNSDSNSNSILRGFRINYQYPLIRWIMLAPRLIIRMLFLSTPVFVIYFLVRRYMGIENPIVQEMYSFWLGWIADSITWIKSNILSLLKAIQSMSIDPEL